MPMMPNTHANRIEEAHANSASSLPSSSFASRRTQCGILEKEFRNAPVIALRVALDIRVLESRIMAPHASGRCHEVLPGWVTFGRGTAQCSSERWLPGHT